MTTAPELEDIAGPACRGCEIRIAEVERLRAALREVVSEGHRDTCKISIGRCSCSYSDAVVALGEQ